MAAWTFFGRVLPERVALSAPVPALSVEVGDLGFAFSMITRLASSQMVISVEVESGDPDIFTLRNAVETKLRQFVDLVGYEVGLSLDLEIVSAVGPGEEWQVFGVDNSALVNSRREAIDGLARRQIDEELVRAVLATSTTEIVLSDFREALRVASQTGFFCYRAAEAIMHSLKVTSSQGDAAAWAIFRTKLRVSRGALDLLKRYADPVRHGRLASITGADRETVLRITDEIISRYINYLRTGLPTRSEISEVTVS